MLGVVVGDIALVGGATIEARNELLWGVLYGRYCAGGDTHHIDVDANYRDLLLHVLTAFKGSRGPPDLAQYLTALPYGSAVVGAKKYLLTGAIGFSGMVLQERVRVGNSRSFAVTDYLGEVLVVAIVDFEGTAYQGWGGDPSEHSDGVERCSGSRVRCPEKMLTKKRWLGRDIRFLLLPSVKGKKNVPSLSPAAQKH